MLLLGILDPALHFSQEGPGGIVRVGNGASNEACLVGDDTLAGVDDRSEAGKGVSVVFGPPFQDLHALCGPVRVREAPDILDIHD
jgi:hypothetical protein